MFNSEQAIELIRQLIRIDTTNPPGNEEDAVQFLESVLIKEDMDVTVFTPVKRKANIMAKIEGKRHGNPIVLLNHIDVVPARKDEWDTDPFGAEIRDGYLYGRGAIDMKSQTICQLLAFLNLKDERILPERDIIFLATCDEEVGGEYGLKYLLHDVKELRQASFVLSEGGGIIEEDGKVTAQIAVSEKRVAQFSVRAKGTGGHGSMPHKDNANEKVVRAAQAILAYQWPLKPTAVVSAYMKGAFQDDPRFDVPFTTLREMVKRKSFRRFIEENPIYNALLRNTVTLTVMRGGDKVNVIPSEAEALFDARILPSENQARFFEKITKLAGPGVTVEPIERREAAEPGRSDFRTPWFRGIGDIVEKYFGDIPVVPAMTTGATDMRYFRELGITAYGFFPVIMSIEDLRRMHGANERISIENLLKGLDASKEIVRFLAQKV